MMRLPRAIRHAELEWFRARAQHVLLGSYRSALLAVATYGNTVRRHLVTSTRAVPLWPHVCRTDGEQCEASTAVGDELDGFRGLPPYNDDRPLASHVPFAIARLGSAGIEAEMLERPYDWAREDLLPIALPEPLDWLSDPRARSLYDEVCANATSDEPRHVLADYLLEHDYDHGIVVAFGLARTLEEDAYQRHERVLRECGPRWLGPLLRVIPAHGAHFRRGFLWRAEICAHDPTTRESLRGAPAWGTVEQLRVIGWSPGFALDPAMVALREVGTIDEASIRPLLDNPRPWKIERLDISLDVNTFDPLARATNLPALRHLRLSGAVGQFADQLPSAAWWPQLETVELVVSAREDWFARAQKLAQRGPRVAVDEGSGWQLAFAPDGRVRASMIGFDPLASRAQLGRLVALLPSGVTLEPSRFFAPRDGDLPAPSTVR